MNIFEPKVLSENYRKALKGGSKVVNLHDWSPHFNQFALEIAPMLAEDIPSDIYKVLFKVRWTNKVFLFVLLSSHH